MKSFKHLFIFLGTLVLFTFLVWIFLATFWFHNLFNPAEMWRRFFSQHASQYARGGQGADLSLYPQFLDRGSVLGRIIAFRNFLSSTTIPGPNWITPVILLYLLPFAMGITFSVSIILIIKLVSYLAYGRKHKHEKVDRYDKYDDRSGNYQTRNFHGGNGERFINRTRQIRPQYYDDFGTVPNKAMRRHGSNIPEPYGYRETQQFRDKNF